MYLCISSEFALAKYRSAIEELKLDMFLQLVLSNLESIQGSIGNDVSTILKR